jgi:hypothetical protein
MYNLAGSDIAKLACHPRRRFADEVAWGLISNGVARRAG